MNLILLQKLFVIIVIFSMLEYELFGETELLPIFKSVLDFLIDAYASGETRVSIFMQSPLAHDYIVKWSPGWLRRAGPAGIWLDSQGTYYN